MATTAVLEAEVEPREAGLDPERLARLDRHLDRFVSAGAPGSQVVIARGGRIAHTRCGGQRDIEAGAPVEPDTVWRIYSMTKPITSVAAMMLWEEGAFELTDPVAGTSRRSPTRASTPAGRRASRVTVPATEPIRVWHLLTHTAGLTYGFHHAHVVDEIYRDAGFELGTPRRARPRRVRATRGPRCRCCSSPARSGTTRWRPTCSAALVEVVSGQPLDAFFAERIFAPLGMDDTGFWRPARPSGPARGAVRAATRERPRAVRDDAHRRRSDERRPTALSGGGGLRVDGRRLPRASPGCCSAAASSTACGCSSPADRRAT